MIDFSPMISLFAKSINTTLQKRHLVIKELFELLAKYEVFIDFDESLFYSSRAYAGIVFQLQNRLVNLIKKCVHKEIDIHVFQNLAKQYSLQKEDDPLLVIEQNKMEEYLQCGIYPQNIVDDKFLDYISLAGMESLVQCGTGVILIGDKIFQKSPIKNHSDEFHLFSINIDYVIDNPVKTAEAIIHENGHNLLNLFLQENDIILEVDKLIYFSPWTNSKRHDRGIIHGYFAFSMVIIFYQGLKLPKYQIEINKYIEIQKKNIEKVAPDVEVILKKYPQCLVELINNVISHIK